MKKILCKQKISSIKILLGIIVLFIVSNVHAQLTYTDFTDGGAYSSNYMYRYLKPINYDSQKSYPLVIFLHGGGGNGTNNTSQFTDQPIFFNVFTTTEMRTKYPVFILAPQVTWLTEHFPEELLGMVKKLRTGDNLNIDTNRIYVTGLSRGGKGSRTSSIYFTKSFACAAPTAGRLVYCDSIYKHIPITPLNPAKTVSEIEVITNAKRWVKKIPIWASTCDQDGSIDPNWSRNIVACMRNNGAHPLFTMYYGCGHISWNYFYEEQKFPDWMFSQSRAGGPAPQAPYNIQVISRSNSATITWLWTDSETDKFPLSITGGPVLCYHVYKNGIRLTIGPDDLTGADESGLSKFTTATTFTDNTYKAGDTYTVTAVNYRQQESTPSLNTEIENVNEEALQTTIFPNPANDFVSIDFGNLYSAKEITLIDVQGRIIVQKQTSDNNLNLNISEFQKGVYFIKISTTDNILIKKFIIE